MQRRVFGVCWSNPDKSDLSYLVFEDSGLREEWLAETQDYENRSSARLKDYPVLRNALRQNERDLSDDDRIGWIYREWTHPYAARD